MDVLRGQLEAVLKSQTRFGIIQFVLSLVSWTTVIALTVDIYGKDKLAFTCSCNEVKDSATINRHCYMNYAEQYDKPLSQVSFALISGCSVVGSWIIYAICIAPRINYFRTRGLARRACCSAYCSYFSEVTIRIFITGAMISLYFLKQQKNFPEVFSCFLESKNINNCSCYVYSTDKSHINLALFLINAVLCLFAFAEMLYLLYLLIFKMRPQPVTNPFQHLQQHVDEETSCFPPDHHFFRFLFNETPYDNLQATDELDGPQSLRNFSIELKGRILQETERFTNTFSPDRFDYVPLNEEYTQKIIRGGNTKYKFKQKYRHDVLQECPAATAKSMTLEKFTDSCVCRPLLVTGRAGIGKTFFSMKLLHEWAKGNMLKKFRLAFLLNFRQLNLLKAKQLMKLSCLLEMSLNSPSLPHWIFKYMVNHAANVLIIFDGLDEYSGCKLCVPEEKRFPNNAFCKMTVAAFYAKLAMGRILPGAAIITTTRPTAVACVAEIYSNASTFEILGFSSDNVCSYLKQYFILREDLTRIISKYIFSNANLSSLCYIPVCCMIICSYLSYFCSEHEVKSFDSLPNTLTELYNGVLEMFIRKHGSEYQGKSVQGQSTKLSDHAQETIEKLSLLAHTTLKTNKLIFRRKDFADLGLEKDIPVLVSSGLIYCMPRCRTGPITFEDQYCFIHLTLQEFLAAKMIALNFSQVEFDRFVESLYFIPKWELVIQFVAGLLSQNTQNGYAFSNELFRKLHGAAYNVFFVDDAPELQVGSEGSLFVEADSDSFRTRSLSLSISGGSGSGFHRYQHFEETFENNSKSLSSDVICSTPSLSMHLDELQCQSGYLLLTMKCVHEQQDRQHARDVAITIGRSLDLSGIHLCDVDIFTAVFFTFKHAVAGILEYLNLFNNHITALGCAKLAELLRYGLGPSKALNLDSNDVGDDGIESIAGAMTHASCTLEKLNVSKNGLSRLAIVYLSDAITHPNCRLRSLDIGYNKIGRSSLSPLGKALKHPLCKLTQLDLPHCGIGNDDCKILAKSLKNANCQLICLNIQKNHLISGSGIIFLASSLSKPGCKLESLNLGSTGCSERDMMPACRELAKNITHSQLSSLTMCNCKVNDDSINKLMEAVSNPKCKLVDLDLGKNLISHKGCHYIVKALCSPACGLHSLSLQENQIGDSGAVVFTHALECQSFKLQSLDVSYNEISPDAQTALLNAWGDLREGLALI